MSEASASEAGTYTCRASNAHGHRDTQLNVQVVGSDHGKPAMFLSRPDTSMSVAESEDISFSFRVSGEPKPKGTLDYSQHDWKIAFGKHRESIFIQKQHFLQVNIKNKF